MHLNSILLQHVQERRFARIVQSQEEDLGALVVESYRRVGGGGENPGPNSRQT